jgi:hypothetical protein
MSNLKSLFHVSNHVDKSTRISYEESQAIVALANAVVENARAISAICNLASVSGPVANVSNCNFYNNASDTSAMSVGSEDPEEMEDPVEVEESEDLEDSEV